MTDSQSQNEPSMEEILASIRKIISEDDPEQDNSEKKAEDDAPAAEAEAEEQAAEGEQESGAAESESGDGEDEVLDLTKMVDEHNGGVIDVNGASEEQAEAAPEAAPEDAEAGEAAEEPAPDEAAESEARNEMSDEGPGEAKPDDGEDEPLLSEETAAGTTAALGEVARTVRAGREPEGPLGGDRTLERLVREALEPHLKAWLDENLEALVERVVREEVRRLARRVEDE